MEAKNILRTTDRNIEYLDNKETDPRFLIDQWQLVKV